MPDTANAVTASEPTPVLHRFFSFAVAVEIRVDSSLLAWRSLALLFSGIMSRPQLDRSRDAFCCQILGPEEFDQCHGSL